MNASWFHALLVRFGPLSALLKLVRYI